MPLRLHTWAVFVVAAIIGAFLLVSAHRMYPIPDVDAAAFLPQAVNLARGEGMVNPMFNRVAAPDPATRGRAYYYPPLFTIAVAGLMREPNARGAFVAVALLDVVALLLCAALLARAAGMNSGAGGRGTPLLALLVCLALLGLAGQMKNAAGRPESLGTVFVAAVGLLAMTRPLPGTRTVATAGLVLGLMGASHPFGGVLLGCMLAGWVLATHRGREAIALLLLLGAAALATFLVVAWASATDLRLLLGGLAQNARLSVLPAQQRATLWEYYVTGVRFPLLGVLLLAAVGAALALMRRHRAPIASPVGFGAAIVAGLAATGYLTLRTPTRYYNLALVAPLAYAVLLAWLASRAPAARIRGRSLPAVLLVLLFAGTGAGFVRRALLYSPTLSMTRSWEESRADFRRLSAGLESILVSHSLWVLSEDYERLQLNLRWTRPCPYGLLIQQQAASRLSAPPEQPGHTRIFSSFVAATPTVLGLPLTRSVGGYGFAAYVPIAGQRPEDDCEPRH